MTELNASAAAEPMSDERLAEIREHQQWYPTDDGRDLLAEVDRLRAMEQRIRDLHPRLDNPRGGCCASPKVCVKPHPPVCNGVSHGLNRPVWPCAEIAALDGTEAGR